MDFTNRGAGQTPQHSAPEHEQIRPQAPLPRPTAAKSSGSITSKGLRIAQVVLLVCITVLIVAALILLGTNENKDKSVSNENLLVDTSKIQAVFLSNDQVYFGKINVLDKDYIHMSNVHYLRVSQQVQPGQEGAANTPPELVRIGCELHRPTDNMVINRSQVTFWENLKNETDVNTISGGVKKLAELQKGGQKCATAPTNTNNKPASSATPTPSPTPTPAPAARP